MKQANRAMLAGSRQSLVLSHALSLAGCVWVTRHHQHVRLYVLYSTSRSARSRWAAACLPASSSAAVPGGPTHDCVTVSVLHDAAINAPVDDSCTRRRSEWAAAAAEGRTVNRDGCNWHLGWFSTPSRILLVFCCFISVNRFIRL